MWSVLSVSVAPIRLLLVEVGSSMDDTGMDAVSVLTVSMLPVWSVNSVSVKPSSED